MVRVVVMFFMAVTMMSMSELKWILVKSGFGNALSLVFAPGSFSSPCNFISNRDLLRSSIHTGRHSSCTSRTKWCGISKQGLNVVAQTI